MATLTAREDIYSWQLPCRIGDLAESLGSPFCIDSVDCILMTSIYLNINIRRNARNKCTSPSITSFYDKQLLVLKEDARGNWKESEHLKRCSALSNIKMEEPLRWALGQIIQINV